ncbi:putative peroxisomal catalase [Clavispora lusitaniae]|uniref:Peroxisomal catalase n=1 Tax=Clavispora lusitaniae TaxID=36911 RepID=A0ACD0WSA7_CLALS|nr:peroxisomal catalase A [Clavispora lusitaniae]QFZ30453.1 putative peroxisomal catalase [Clavispora lusitaniae]QFZ36115.1 putative peroxisomal catalase [Clavispora lusitaniae]QFZ41799.1 putative peroxisomal catalase [Clavispora lusitaniae]QFZ47475.1 putative peroxisomal catalase [Clavispora lusitaniae]
MAPPTFTNSNGCPIPEPFATQRVGKHGPLLLQDFNLIDSLAHFDRERIPERVVHAKGSGAYGVFEVTDDITDICSAKFLDTVGKKTKVFTRFSTVGGESGSADAARDPRGFSTKLYTEEGNLDLVYNNTPVFFIRDPSKFPHFIHTQKRNPETHLKDANMFWDYLTSNEESIHQVMTLFSDRGTPRSYREMNGYSGHTYKWSTKDGNWHYVQVHFISDQGVKTLTNEEAGKLAGENPDHAQEDLFRNIADGNFPSWTCYIQTMTAQQAKEAPFSVFDLTKVWPHKDYPLRRFGKLTLNENPKNYFAEVEQAAFSPAHTVPYMEPSADPVLQSRLFSYADTHRHRLGPNYTQIPVNCPITGVFNPHMRDGVMNVNGNLGSTPNYLASSEPVEFRQFSLQEDQEVWSGAACPFHWKATDAEFTQATALYNVLARYPGQQRNLAHNVAVHVSAADKPIQERVIKYFGKVSAELAANIQKELEAI